jgi:hypothetical protein
MPTASISAAGEPLQLELEPGVSYRSVPGFPGYAVGDDGSLWSIKWYAKWRKRKVSRWRERPGRRSYWFVCLTSGGVKHLIYIHILVLTVFKGPPQPGQEVRHKNGNRHDSRLDNLAWGTRAENMEDKKLHGTHPTGSKNPRARITEDQVVQIRQRHAAGERQCDLADEYGIPRVTVNHICTGYTWKHVPMVAP